MGQDCRASRRPMSSDDRGKLKDPERDLKSVVFGQDKVLDAGVGRQDGARAWARGQTHRLFLFSGPTGVGKTEAAKQLAYIMGIDLIRFDMSEYMEPCREPPDRRAPATWVLTRAAC